MARFRDRVRYQLLRSPLAPAMKARQTLRHRSEISRRDLLAEQLVIDAQAAELAEQLNREGFARLDTLMDPAALGALSDPALAKLAVQSGAQTAAPAGTSSKAFWDRLLDDELIGGRMPADSPYARFAMQPRVLAFLARAMGTLPQLDYVLLTLSLPSDAPLSQSQLWHKDYDDTRTIKVFVYLTDVADQQDGPFTFVPGPVSEKLGYTLHSHLPDERVFRAIPRSAVRSMIAPALSAFAVETSRCLHMGSRVAAGHRRLLYTATYTTYPKLDGSTPRGFVLSGAESPVERAVLAPGSDTCPS